jgi:hypothetical protein
MNKVLYTIYWTIDDEPQFRRTPDLKFALSWMEYLRKYPKCSAITFCSENDDQVGKMGVDAVVDGMLPDGLEYVYKTGRDRGRDPR